MEFKHTSVLFDECMEGLDIKPDGIYVDGTMGGGGHSSGICSQLSEEGTFIGIDRDMDAHRAAQARLADYPCRKIFVQSNYSDIKDVLEELGIDHIDGALLDLGVSSFQLDNPERGFSYKVDGPLDLRLDPEHGESATDRLKNITREEFEGMMIENSDEPYAEEIAKKVFFKMQRGEKIETTTDLKNAIEEALVVVPAAERKDAVKKSCARVFQALRIDVNSEFEVLYGFLDKLPDILNQGARVAILTFHSGEDRLVKKAFKHYKKIGVYSEISEDVTRPSAEECARNPRAKSTKLRWAIKA